MTPLQQLADGTLPPGNYDVGPGTKLPPPSNGSSGQLTTHSE